MDEQEFIQQELARLLRDWFIRATLIGAGAFLLLSPLDYVSVPEHFSRFLVYRVAMSSVLVTLALIASRLRSVASFELMAFMAIFFSASTIEVMILQFHGHHSPYYAGMILLAVVALGFFPAGLRFHLLLAGTIYLVYLVPLLIAGDIHDPRTFFTQNYFLLLILGAGMVIRHYNLSHLKEKIRLHHRMQRQSEDLERIIEERTVKLIKASDEWRVTFDSTEDMMMLVDGAGDIIKANKALAAFTGSDIRELVGASCFDICSRQTIPEKRHPLRRMLSSGRREQGEFYSPRRDRWFLVSAEPLQAGRFREQGAVLIMRDITGIKILEQGLLESKEEWEETFNIIEEGISIHDEEHNILQANAAARRLLNIGDESVEGKKCYKLFHGSDEPMAGCPSCEARRTGRATTADFYEPTLGRYFEVTALPRPARGGRSAGIIHVTHDITERKEAIDEIDRAYRRMESILEMAPFGVIIVNREGLIEYANSAIQSISGLSAVGFIGTPVGELQGCRDIGLNERILTAFGGETFRLGPVEFQCRDGDEKSVGQFTGIPVKEAGKEKVVVFIDNVTDLKRAEEERTRLQAMLLETQKMESIGTLAGGIAHDFNNILTAIMNYAGLVLMKLPEESPVRPYVSTILDSGEKAAGLTRQLLDFSRRQPLQRRAVDLNVVVENHIRMLRRIIGEDISLDLNLHRPLKNILADAGKVEQILLNLAVNGRDAMSRGGTLAITTAPAGFEEEQTIGSNKLSPGQYVRLTVSDTGTGMNPEIRKRIFEPFFTTKGAGEGTGLGLATVYGIVQKHKGAIDVISREGEGSSFTIYFPVTLEAEVMDGSAVPTKLAGGNETVLVVDDDEKILSSTVEVLSSLGYNVLFASSGESAIDIVDNHRGPIDLLLTDIIMKGMDGKELAESVTDKRPALKVLFMSGYADASLGKRGVTDLPAQILQKPVTIETLGLQVRETLGS